MIPVPLMLCILLFVIVGEEPFNSIPLVPPVIWKPSSVEPVLFRKYTIVPEELIIVLSAPHTDLTVVLLSFVPLRYRYVPSSYVPS